MNFLPVLKWTSGLVAGFVATSIVVLGWILFTESGTNLAWRTATYRVAGLQAERVQGRLAEGLMVSNLIYETDSITIRLEEAGLNWQLNGPLFDELLISKFELSGLSVTVLEAEADPESSQAIELPDGLPLPISLIFADIKITDFQFYSDEQSPPLEISNAALRGKVSADEVTVQLVNMNSPFFTLTGDASSFPSKRYQTVSEFSWTVSAPTLFPAQGSLTISGNQKELNYRLVAEAQGDSYGDLSLESNGSVGLNEMVVRSLNITHAQSPAKLAVDGRLMFADSNPKGSFNIHWSELQWPLIQPVEEAAQSSSPSLSQTWVRSEQGQIALSGTANQYRAVLNASISTPSSSDGSIQLTATGDTTSIDINKLDIRAFKGKAEGMATFNWHEEFIANFEFQGKHIDPGEVFPQWPGDVSFFVKGNQRDRVTELGRFEASGTMRARAFKLDAALSRDGAGITVPRFTLTAGESLLNLKGSVGENVNLEWNLQSPDLAELFPDAAGKMASHGTLLGEMPWPSVHAELSIADLKMGAYRIGTAQLSTSIDPLSEDISSLVLHAKDLVVANSLIESLQLTASGKRSLLNASLTVDSGPVKLTTDMGGGWHNGIWQGALKSGELTLGPLASWQLGQPQKLHFSTDLQVIKLGCWISGDARLCLEGERKNEKISSSVELLQLPIDYFKPLLASTVELRGSVGGSVDFNYLGSGRWSTEGGLASSISAIGLIESEAKVAINWLEIDPGTLNFKGDEQKVSANFSLPLKGGGGARGGVTITDNSQAIGQTALIGDIAVHLPSINFLSVVSQELQSIAGELKLDAAVTGTPESPTVNGSMVLSGASVKLLTPGLELTEVEMVATGEGLDGINYRGKARSGGGFIEIEGKSVTTGLPASSELRITGNDFQLWNSADAQITASPNLLVVISEDLINITGGIEIPSAGITPQELPSGAIPVSPDQVIVLTEVDPEQDIAEALARDARVQVDLVLGEKVEMEGFGFKGRMEGQLAILQEPNYPMVASGEFKILDGEYRAYGQGLVIDSGQILFAGGAIDNPGLSIRALRRPVPGIVVGVYANGELRQPEVSLFSEPNMSQSEQLSWLVLGRSIEDSSGAETDYITQAALVLGLKGGNFLTENIGQNLGLDTIGFEAGSGEAGSSNDVNQAALVLGKYLTPQLYISYGIGLLDSLSTVKLRYLMTDRWNLITESSAIASGGDISYSFEK